MKCFVHRESEAVGACRHCGRGVCGDCAVAGTKLTCKGACQSELAVLDTWIGQSRARAKWAYHAAAIVASSMAVMSWVAAAFTAPGGTQVLFFCMGGLFTILAVVRIRQIRRWDRSNAAKMAGEARGDEA